METTTLYSSDGDVTISTPNGFIVEKNITEDSWIHSVERFDIAEYNDWFFKRYGIQPDLSELDILELGYWNKDGYYGKADEFRYTIREELEKNGTLKVYNNI